MTRPKPFTQKEWQEMMSMTLHGPLPQKTLYRVYTTVDSLFLEVEQLNTPHILDTCEFVEEVVKLKKEVEELKKQRGIRASEMVAKLREEGGSRIQEVLVEKEDLRVENERLNGQLLQMVELSTKADILIAEQLQEIGRFCDMIAELIKKRGLPDHNSPEGMALIRKLARERSRG